ncbi:MAG: hypothetical protein ACWA5P_02035 [bacterium]
MFRKEKRKRITKPIKDIEVEDPLEYKSNCATDNAQLIYVYDELKVELWCDKHYNLRRTVGDSDGKREGIEIEPVKNLIIEGFKFLLDIYLQGVPFKFINYFDITQKNKPPIRVVLQRPVGESVLNVVSEIHFLDTSKFEITVITAMVINDFKIGDGQYALYIGKNNIVLNRKIRGSLIQKHKIYL